MANPILSATERQAAVADDLGRSYALELAKVKRDLERELHRLLVEATTGKRTPVALAARALGLRRELRQMLEDAGFDRLAAAGTARGLDRMALAVERTRLAAQVSAFTTRDAARIEALKELARLDLLAQGDDVATAVWRSVVQGVYSQRKPADILDDLAEVLDRSIAEVGNLYDTSVSIFGRQIELLKATGEPDELLLFSGPIDDRTRPFCLQRVGRVYTAAEVDDMDNGQLPNVRLTGGGYQCRHHWVALSKFSELRDLAGTSERMPEVRDAVAKAIAARRKKAA
jgi:hypothetical protein